MLSLLLLLAVLGVWARSFWVADWVGRLHYSPGIPNENHHVYLRTARGAAVLIGGGDPASNFSHTRWVWERGHPWAYPVGRDAPPLVRAVGIGWENEHRLRTGETTWAVHVHLAWPAGLLGLTTCVLALRRRSTTRGTPGRCAACDYDLTGNVSGVCPECGSVTRSPAAGARTAGPRTPGAAGPPAPADAPAPGAGPPRRAPVPVVGPRA